MATKEEEEYNRCSSADLRRRVDNGLLGLTDGLLLSLIVVTKADAVTTAVGSTATAMMAMPATDVIAVHWAEGLGGRQRQQRRDGG